MISIVIPLYNKAQHVASCLQAAMRQRDFNDFEIVAVDDGSTDGSDKILDEMGENCNSLRIFHISNSGATAARRYGVKQAKGDYIMFCDADDMLDEHALATAYDAITRTGADEVIGRFSNSVRKNNHELQGRNESRRAYQSDFRQSSDVSYALRDSIPQGIARPLL